MFLLIGRFSEQWLRRCPEEPLFLKGRRGRRNPVAHIIAGIDVGTTKVCTLIAEVEEEEEGSPFVRIIGIGDVPSKGMRRGGVVNLTQVTDSIIKSVEQAERLAGVSISKAYVSVTGTHIASISSRGVVAIHRRGGGITPEDVARVVDAASAIAVPYNREILHSIPRYFVVDDQGGIQDPVGMEGTRLEAEVHIITASTPAVNNLIKCVREAGVEVEELILASLASGEAVLTPAEKEMGVIVADIGGGTTDVAVYAEGSVLYAGTLEVGGEHITNDIAFGLRMPFSSAEEVKKKYGHSLPDEIPEEEGVEALVFGEEAHKSISRRFMAEVIQARMEEIFELIYREVQKAGYEGLLPAGLVLCGGTAELSGISKLGRRYLNMPVRVGRPSGIHGLVDALGSPAYATAVGLILWPLRHRPYKIEAKGYTWLGKIIDWLKSFLPD
ncbi:MAG: cell division protein FtsA [Chloroflexi bacterium]|nr:MAG: cell division protein FtsA [Chloroflexota bacterium]